MKPSQNEKINDYLSGLEELAGPSNVPFGVIIASETDREGVLRIVKFRNWPIIEITSRHPDIGLRSLAKELARGSGVVLDVRKLLPPKLINHLQSLKAGVLFMMLAGEEKPVLINPIPAKSRVVLLMAKKQYKELRLQDIFSSACRV